MTQATSASPTCERRRAVIRQAPCVDRITERSLVLETRQKRLALTPSTIQLLASSQLESKRAVFVTPADAALSPQLTGELARMGAEWIVRDAEGALRQARTGRPLHDIDDVFALSHEPAQLPDAEGRMASVELEVVVHHRATDNLRVGRVAERIVAELGSPPLTGLGMTEPLVGRWNLDDLTHRAQLGMPNTSTFRAGNDAGAALALSYDRDVSGVIERITGVVPVGPYDAVLDSLTERCADSLMRLQREFLVTIGLMSAADTDLDGWMRMRQRGWPVPRALLLGPYAVRVADIDPATMAWLGAENLGRARVPSLLFRFPGDRDQAMRAQTAVLETVGVRNALVGLGVL